MIGAGQSGFVAALEQRLASLKQSVLEVALEWYDLEALREVETGTEARRARGEALRALREMCGAHRAAESELQRARTAEKDALLLAGAAR